jgi:Trans-aconitate methyltransferase
MYNDLASWFHLVTAPADYADEAAEVVRLLADHGVELGPLNPDATLLELGSGGGNTASHLKARAHLTLTDIAPAMLALSVTLNPECEHVEGDMRTLRLGRTFDAVLLHDAVTYMETETDLRAAMETALVHLRPGGVAVLLPDFTAETFRPETRHGGHDSSDGRSLRYLEWRYDPDPTDTTVLTDYAYLLREPDGSVRGLEDRHIEGIFPRATWLRLLADVGFRADVSVDEWEREVFVGVRALEGTHRRSKR